VGAVGRVRRQASAVEARRRDDAVREVAASLTNLAP